jgi:hypothetical protein
MKVCSLPVATACKPSKPYVIRPLPSTPWVLGKPAWQSILTWPKPVVKPNQKGQCGTYLLRVAFDALTPEQQRAFVADIGTV